MVSIFFVFTRRLKIFMLKLTKKLNLELKLLLRVAMGVNFLNLFG